MHDLAMAEAARPAPVSILRLPMLTYSIGHEILLLGQRNPLLFDRADFEKLPPAAQRAALIRAVLICYRTWGQNQKPERNLWLWAWSIRKTDWAVAIADWRNYRAAGSTFPPAPTQEAYLIAKGAQNDDPGRELGGSNLARLLAFCCAVHRSLGYSCAFDVPFGLAAHLYLSDLEMAGNARIENQRERQVRLEMEEHRKSVEKEELSQHSES